MSETLCELAEVTIDDIMSWGPCWIDDLGEDEARRRIESLFDGRRSVTARDALKFDISASDRLWVVLREEMLPASLLREFACRVASDAMDRAEARGGKVDPRSRNAIAVKRRWIKGEATDQELAAARDAAWGVALGAALDAARDAAAALRDAAMAAAWDAQVQVLSEMIDAWETGR